MKAAQEVTSGHEASNSVACVVRNRRMRSRKRSQGSSEAWVWEEGLTAFYTVLSSLQVSIAVLKDPFTV